VFFFCGKSHSLPYKKDADETGIENEDSNKEPAKDTWIFAIRAAKSIDIEKLF